jgi:hypothetical protein
MRAGLLESLPAQEATWGRFLVLADPDGRSVVLAKMRPSVPAYAQERLRRQH